MPVVFYRGERNTDDRQKGKKGIFLFWMIENLVQCLDGFFHVAAGRKTDRQIFRSCDAGCIKNGR